VAQNTTLRFAPTAPGLRVFVNGFLLINDLDGEGATHRIAGFLAPGDNTLSLSAEMDARAAGRTVVIASDDPFAAPVADLSWPAPDVAGVVTTATFVAPDGAVAWSWTEADPVEGEATDQVHGLLTTLAEAFLDPDPGQLLQFLAVKHDEVGRALGIGKERMDAGLARGLAARREQGGLATDVVPAGDLTLIWSPDRTHARALRSDGTDALSLVVAGTPQPFEVHVGRLRGAWTILR
jgi:hypothetical protein